MWMQVYYHCAFDSDTVLGGTRESLKMLGQTLATTLATAFVDEVEEQRLLCHGLGLEKADQEEL